MSASTALVSLRQILVTILHLQPRYHIHNRSQLENILEEVDLFLNFLDVSRSTHEASQAAAEVETRMGDVAREAELLIDGGGGVLNYGATSSGNFLYLTLLIATLLSLLTARVHLWVRERYGFPSRNASQAWRRLSCDFEIIGGEVNLINESSSSSSSSSHEALMSLSRILGSITLDDSGNCLKSLQEKVNFLLENASSSRSAQKNLDAKTRDAVYKAKRALIEFQLPSKSDLIFDPTLLHTKANFMSLLSTVPFFFLLRLRYFTSLLGFLGQSYIAIASYLCSYWIARKALLPVRYNYEAPDDQEVARVARDFDNIVKYVIEIKDGSGEAAHDLSTTAASSSRKDWGGSGRDVVMGLESEVDEIKARLFRDSSKLELVSIVGMGGIGKTTLANKVYHDHDVVDRFDVLAWTTVSPGNTLRHVLLSLLDSARMLAEEGKHSQDSDEELGVHLHRFLMYRRYLVVVDDVWDAEIWGFLRRHLPENGNDSRVLLTSRLPTVVSRLDSRSRLHHMQCLDEDHSWELLRREVFGAEEGCPLPSELECIGRKIARRCGGLPLAIVVIGGLLYKDVHVDVWRDVADKLEKSEVQDIKEQCLDILSLSYNHLPRHLRPCFLYTGAFLAHTEIPISTLIHLWIAEGFLRPRESKTVEEAAEGYVKDLIGRKLISVSKWSCDGKMRACTMHDLLRDVCVENARKEKFRHVVESGGYVIARGGPDEPPRSLSIHPNAARADEIHGYLDSLHLRVVNVLGAKFGEFPLQITQLVSLRYLAIRYDGSVPIPPSIFKLRYLETLVLHHSSSGKRSFLPSSIWRMPNLRHVYVKPSCYMFKLFGHQFLSDYSLLMNLQTIVGIRNFEWTKRIVEKVPNLKKLGISYDFSSSASWSTYQLENLVYLEKLESLKIGVKYDDVRSSMSHEPSKLAFPQKLKKLSLSGCRIPWESMAAIGALPNLEAFKLRSEAFSGLSWKTAEEEFPRLVFLLLEDMSLTTWESEDGHFPRLQRLVLRSCSVLEEIPFSFGDIPTLELIQLVDCRDSAVASAIEIQEEQESMGNEVLKFHIEQRRREVDGMNSEARGILGPGAFQVAYDAMFSTQLEFLVSLLCLLLLALATVLPCFYLGVVWLK